MIPKAYNMTISDLPYFIDCSECPDRHFLNVVRCADGSWSIAYIEFDHYTPIQGLALNNAATLNEAAARMSAAIERWKRRTEWDGGSWEYIN